MSHETTEYPHPGRWRRQEYLAMAGLWLLLLLLLLPGMTSQRLLDDLDENFYVSTFKGWADTLRGDSFGLFRPLKNLLYYAFHVFGQPSLPVWHAINFGAYLTSVVAVYALARRVTRSVVAGFVVTVLWAACPTQVSTAIWMSCVNISVSLALACVAMIYHDRSWENGERWKPAALIAVVTTFLAQTAYETAVCVGPLCVLLDLLRGRRIFSKAALWRYGLLVAATVAFILLRESMGAVNDNKKSNFGFDPAMTPWQLMLSAPWLLWRHFSMWLFPFGRIEFASTYLWKVSASPVALALAGGFLVVLVASVVLLRKRLPIVAFGLGWFLVASFPASNFIPVRAGPIEDYYLVFPGVGLALALVGGAAALVKWLRARDRFPVRGILAGMVLTAGIVWRGASIVLCHHQAELWARPEDLYRECIETRPAQYQAKALMVREMLLRWNTLTPQEKQVAEWVIWDSCEEGPWVYSNSMLAGEVAAKEGHAELALAYFRQSEERSVKGTRIYYYLMWREAQLLADENNIPEASAKLRTILVEPLALEHYQATRLLSSLYVRDGKPDKARQTLEKSLEMHPDKAAELHEAIKELAGTASPQ